MYQSWLQAAAVEKRIHDSLMPRARQWVEADTEEKSGFLLSGNDLDQALKLSARQPGWLSSAEADLIATSQSHHTARQRRERRKTRAILAFAVISMVFAVIAGLMFYLQTDLTQQARQSAERAKNARSEAEQLINFMTFDLREKLAPIGRLDLMKDVQLRVNNYYAHLGIEGQNKKVLRRQAVNYFNHGEIVAKQGNLETAIESYKKGLEIFKRLAAADPTNSQWQLDMVVSFWRLSSLEDINAKLVRDYLNKGLEILRKLESEGKLHGEQQHWTAIFTGRLEAFEAASP
jgi:tetratricopeptide (TPR) repeat protein